MQRGLAGQYRSEVDDPDFFLSGKRNDPAAEWQATVAALRDTTPGPRNAWCRFPARARYLAARGLVTLPAPVECPALAHWRSQFYAERLVLVYPEPYLRNIASIFGHTFLRVDALDTTAHPLLLSKAISYYADVASAGGTVSYIAKGLGGGFDGVIEVAPYFRKLAKYSDDEDRDVWEYTLAYTPDEVRWFIDHVWEVRGHSFQYFFLDENCSYRLVAMLDVISPTHRLREQFTVDTLPVDTVKAFYQAGLVADTRYVPSARKLFYQQLATLDTAQQAEVLAVALGKQPSPDTGLATLALAADYSAMQMRTDPAQRTTHALQVRSLIEAQVAAGTVLPPPPATPAGQDPAREGHAMERWQLGVTHTDSAVYGLLGGRMAYHDFHDPLDAYQPAVALDVLDLQVQVALDHASAGGSADDIALERMTWFALRNFSRRDAFFREPSWGLALARQREWVGGERELLHVAEGYRGVAQDCGPFLCHAEWLGGVLAGEPLDLGWTARTGIRVGALYQRERWTQSVTLARQAYLWGEDDTVTRLELETGYPLAPHLSLHAAFTHDAGNGHSDDRFTLSLRGFF